MWNVWCELRRAAILALLTAACSAGQTADSSVAASELDIDAEVISLEQDLALAGQGPDAAAIRERLNAVRDRAVVMHVDAGYRALRNQELAHAESELKPAQRMAPEDARVLALRDDIANARLHVTTMVANSRGRLQKLAGLEHQARDRGEWLALLADLDELALWTQAFPDTLHLREEARGPATTWLLAEARSLLQAKQLEAGKAMLARAAELSPGAPAVLQMQAELSAANAEVSTKQADALQAEGKFEPAMTAYQQILQRQPANAAALDGLAATRRQFVGALLQEAREHQKGGRLDLATTSVNQALAVAAPDEKLTAAARSLSVEVNARLIAPLYARFQAASTKRLDGAALLYGQEILALVGDWKDVGKRVAKLTPIVKGLAAYRLGLAPTKLAKGAPAGMAAALQSAVQERMAKGLGPTVTVVPKAKAGATHGMLAIDVQELTVKRQVTPEARIKQYLDHTEIVDNPAYFEAKGRQSATLTALNVAMDALRPVQDLINETGRALHQTGQQFAEIERKIAGEDTAWYASRPSPCPDGKLTCALTRGHQRWSANIDYYHKAIAKSEGVLRDLEPERVKLQSVVDDKQRSFDEAQKATTETPMRIPSEVWQPLEYTVHRHQLDVTAQLALTWREPGGQPVAGTATLQESNSDVATERVEIKAQVLEPQKASELPGDVTLLAAIAGRLLDTALPPVVQALAHHGERFVRQAGNAKDDLQRVHWLMLAAVAGPALGAEVRAQVLQQLVDLTGWHADTSRIDTEKLPKPAEKPTKAK